MPSTELPTGHLVRRGLSVIRQEVALHPQTFGLAVLGAAIFALATFGTSWAIGRATDRVVTPRFEDGEVAGGTVAVVLAMLVGIGLVRALSIVLRRGMAMVTQARVDSTLRTQVVEQYARLPYAYHSAHPTGELLAHASADAESAAAVFAPLPFATGVIMLVIGAVGWLLATDVPL